MGVSPAAWTVGPYLEEGPTAHPTNTAIHRFYGQRPVKTPNPGWNGNTFFR